MSLPLLPLLLREIHREDVPPSSAMGASNDFDSQAVPLHNSKDAFDDKHTPIRVVVGLVSSLSMIGALLIILSYLCIPSIRTKAREILVHLSIADFGVACANFIGVVKHFGQSLDDCTTASCHHNQHLCIAQAFFAGFSTIASILWTLSLSVYIYFLVVQGHSKIHAKVVYFCYVFCWGMALLVSLWLVLTGEPLLFFIIFCYCNKVSIFRELLCIAIIHVSEQVYSPIGLKTKFSFLRRH